MEMMRRLRAVNVDHLHVGWYQSTYLGSFVNKTLLDSQFSYQSSIEESVVLIYGKNRIIFIVSVVVKNSIQVKIILTQFDSKFPLSSNPISRDREFNFYLNLIFNYNIDKSVV